MSKDKTSGLDVFDALVKKREGARNSESGVQPSGAKAPPRPPGLGPPSSSSATGASVPPPPGRSVPPHRSAPPPPASVGRPPVGEPGIPQALPRSSPGSVPPPPSFSRSSGASVPPPSPPSLGDASAGIEGATLPLQSSQSTTPPARPRSARSVPPPPPSRPPPVSRPPSSGLSAYTPGTGGDDTPTRLLSAPPSRSSVAEATSPRAAPRPLPPLEGAPLPAPGRSPGKLALVVAVVGIAIAGLYFALANSAAELTVTVAGPGGRALDSVEVLLDGEQVCDDSPCQLTDLEPGPHLIRATAKGYQPTADQAVSLESGQQATHHITLTAPSGGTGIRVSATGSGLKLFVDGQEIGALPQTLKDLEPGTHSVRVGGNPRFADWEQNVEVVENKITTLGPVEPKVLKGLATIKAGPGADDARVLLDGRVIPSLPATIEVPADVEHTLVAKKRGYGTYQRSVRFEDGEAEKTFEITMVETEEPEPVAARPAAVAPRRSSPPSRAARPASASASSDGQATLNMNSIPVSKVIVNGRPLGTTPKVGVKVAPGPQTVVFVHPEHGRKVQSGTVQAGATKTFMVRFP